MKKINFTFGIHNHQPIGNFGWILDMATENAYRPFLNTLQNHPKVKISFHFSGILLEYLNDKHQDLIELMKKMIESGQIEILAGGYYEPILVMLYDRDKRKQIEKHKRYMIEIFGYEPKGFWLAERIWEPHLTKSLVEAGIKYTMIDDFAFNAAGWFDEDLFGYYYTEEQGQRMAVFPISEELRYLIPFRNPVETIEFLRSNATDESNRIAIMADDGEKFGVWPGTNKLCYTEKWLDRFFKLLEENSDWIRVLTFSEAVEGLPAMGRIYLPTASYSEMGRWALPTKSRKKFGNILDGIKNNQSNPEFARFLRGGIWRNFLVKYPESNHMQKRMLYVSDRIEKEASKIKRRKDKKNGEAILNKIWNELGKSQCNCAYWHGVFGGLYLFHLRNAIYHHMVSSELLLDESIHAGKRDWLSIDEIDFDKDGYPEVIINNSYYNVIFSPHIGGALSELDIKGSNINITDNITRREEEYHQQLRDKSKEIIKGNVGDVDVKSIHNIVAAKEEDLEKKLFYDRYRKMSLIDHFFTEGETLKNFVECNYKEMGSFVDARYSYKRDNSNDACSLILSNAGYVCSDTVDSRVSITVEKKISIGRTSKGFGILYKIRNNTGCGQGLRFGCEFNFSFSSPNDPNCYFYSPERKYEHMPFSTNKEIVDISSLGMHDEYLKVDLELTFEPACTIWICPVETVSQSEKGVERRYQQSTIIPIWKFNVTGNGDKGLKLWLTIK